MSGKKRQSTEGKEGAGHVSGAGGHGRRILPGAIAGAMLISSQAPALTVHYHRRDGRDAGWSLWAWDAVCNCNGFEVSPAERDAFGPIFRIPEEKIPSERLGLLPKRGDWETKDPWDRIWTPGLGPEIWILSDRPEILTEPPQLKQGILRACWTARDRLVFALEVGVRPETMTPETVRIVSVDSGEPAEIRNIRPGDDLLGPQRLFRVELEEPTLDRSRLFFRVEIRGIGTRWVDLAALLDSEELVPEVPLGAFVEEDRTVIRTWAPAAEAVDLLLYDSARGAGGKGVGMTPRPRGVWETVLEEPLPNRFYMFRVRHRGPEGERILECSDPWARCVVDSHGRGIIVPPTPAVERGPAFDPAEAIIYELHVRDMTIDPHSGVGAPGKYIGLAETGTTLDGRGTVATALDHIRELGVNVVQIMPVQEFENDERFYNWGYKTSHFFSPERWYATGADDISPVIELKQLVRTLHEAGIKVVLDVVFNHTAESDPSIVLNFNGLAPDHFYRVRDDGTYWNGSGVGNEFRSESPMGRRFMIDCLRYWTEEYGIDGFRFDLLGLTDLETIREISSELHRIRPDILLYGEAWAAGETPIRVTTKGDQRNLGFGVFNDDFRNALRGTPFDPRARGFLQGASNRDDIRPLLRGSIDTFAARPTESINYLACHDNRTFWDRLLSTTEGDPSVDDAERERMDRLGAVILLTSQGIPFLHAGMEIRRTKGGDDNSYDAGDAVNRIRWQWKQDHADLFEYYRGLVRLRRDHPIFRMPTAEMIRDNMHFLDELQFELPEGCLGYRLLRGPTADPWSEVLVLLNPTASVAIFPIPAGTWSVAVDDRRVAPPDPDASLATIVGSLAEVPRRSALVLRR